MKRLIMVLLGALLIGAMAVSTYYERRSFTAKAADQEYLVHRALLDSAYTSAILYSPDGGYARLARKKIDNQFAETDRENNEHLIGMVETKFGSSSAASMAHLGYLAGSSDEVARANMDEARRRLQIAKAENPDLKDLYNEIEERLLGLR